MEFIYHSNIPGVFTIFEDEKRVVRVYLSSRLTEADPVNDQFSGFGGIDLGHLENGILIYHPSPYNPGSAKLIKHRPLIHFDKITFDNHILAIKPYPGLDYTYFRFEKHNQPKAIIHNLYHSSTACTREGKVSLPAFIQYCSDLGIDFYLTSFKSTTQDLYITSKELLGDGAIPLQNISFEAAIAKLWLAYNMNFVNPQEFVNRKIYFEFL